MTYRFTSSALPPGRRGEEFGELHRNQIASTVESYLDLFGAVAGRQPWDLEGYGTAALARIEAWAPPLGEELAGLAAGAGQRPTTIAALNARTEILAALRARSGGAGVRGECSTVVALGGPGMPPVAVQNWDWFATMGDNWLEWRIPHEDGRITTTVTEFGILGKIGVNSAGVGVLVNILHHRRDGSGAAAGLGVPVHIIARSVLDSSVDVVTALAAMGTASVSASTALTVVGGQRAGKTAVTAELWPDGPSFVLPEPDGLLLHTNHFLAPGPAADDTEPVQAPDTLVRAEVLRRRLHGQGATLTEMAAVEALTDHTGGGGALCCHADPQALDIEQYQTLATVRLDLDAGALSTTSGPPCASSAAAITPLYSGARS